MIPEQIVGPGPIMTGVIVDVNVLGCRVEITVLTPRLLVRMVLNVEYVAR